MRTLRSLADVEEVLSGLVQAASIEDPTVVVTPETIPINDIPGFDSLNGLEVVTEFEEVTGVELNESIFYQDGNPQSPLTIHTISAAVWAVVQKKGGIHARS